eukprot:scaffold73_cov337-Pavlova_lutheri.AAC.18
MWQHRSWYPVGWDLMGTYTWTCVLATPSPCALCFLRFPRKPTQPSNGWAGTAPLNRPTSLDPPPGRSRTVPVGNRGGFPFDREASPVDPPVSPIKGTGTIRRSTTTGGRKRSTWPRARASQARESFPAREKAAREGAGGCE